MNRQINLKSYGLRTTKLRQELLALFEHSKVALPVSQVLSALAEQGLTPNKTSVYREIVTLQEAGLIEPVVVAGMAVCYRMQPQEHGHHLICDECHSVVDVSVDDLEQAVHKTEAELAKTQGFAITKHELSFHGRCANCQED